MLDFFGGYNWDWDLRLKNNLLFHNEQSSNGGLLTWPNKDDQLNMTEPWQRRALIIELDQNWNRQTFWNQQALTLHPGSS